MRHTFWIAASFIFLGACSKSSSAQGSSDHSGHEPGAAQVASLTDGQVLAIQVGEDGFVPNHIEVKRGSKATLRFTRTTDKTCATAVAFPELGINKPLPLNQSVDVQVPSDQARTLTFQCGMGMYQSKIVVL